MRKSLAVQEVILTIGMAIIGVTLLATQVPGMINDIQSILSEESVKEKSTELANLLSIVTASPGEIRLVYSFPTEKSYNVAIKDGNVNVSSVNDWFVSKTVVHSLEFSKDNAQTLTITKNINGIMVE